jgi:hypothetical protein
MSSKSVKEVIARAVSDGGFRELLFNDPDSALAGYDLTDKERSAILDGLSRDKFDALSSDLGDRVSRAGVHLDDFVGEVIDAIGPVEQEIDPVSEGMDEQDVAWEDFPPGTNVPGEQPSGGGDEIATPDGTVVSPEGGGDLSQPGGGLSDELPTAPGPVEDERGELPAEPPDADESATPINIP